MQHKEQFYRFHLSSLKGKLRELNGSKKIWIKGDGRRHTKSVAVLTGLKPSHRTKCPLRYYSREICQCLDVNGWQDLAQFMFAKNASHPSRPEGEDGFVRAYNGGNFYLAIPDENENEEARVECSVYRTSSLRDG